MSKYRLEMWFDMGATPPALSWGVVKSNNNDDHLVGGGSPLAKNANAAGSQAVLIPDGLESSFDIYLFDASRDGVARDLQWIQVDYTYAGTTTAASPISWAAPLRAGMTGTAFHSDPAGFAGNGPEEKVWSTAPPPINTQRRWSMASGYQGLSDGHFSFCATVRVGPPGTTTGGTTLQFDPEMDVEN